MAGTIISVWICLLAFPNHTVVVVDNIAGIEDCQNVIMHTKQHIDGVTGVCMEIHKVVGP